MSALRLVPGWRLKESLATPERVFLDRRQVVAELGLGGLSIVAIEFTKRRLETFWHKTTPAECGFFSDVDPSKPHPRWSQERETDIGTGEERATLPYNGYAEQVAALYGGDEF